MMRAVAAAVLALAVSGGVAQAAVDCSAVPDAQMAACDFAASGAPSAETLTAQKRQFIRVIVGKNEWQIVIALLRAEHGPVVLEVRDTAGVQPPLVAMAPEALWQEFAARWQTLEADNAAWHNAEIAKRDAAYGAVGAETVCLHPWSADDQSNVTGETKSLSGTACDDGPLVEFAHDLAEKALASTPPCDLTGAHYSFPVYQFTECLKLRGDRRTAALAARAIEDRAWYSNDGKAAILPDAMARFDRAQPVRGAEAVRQAWAAFLKRSDSPAVDVTEITGRGDHVTAKGTITQTFSKAGHYWQRRAAFEQVWLRQPDGSFMLQELSVGRFAPP